MKQSSHIHIAGALVATIAFFAGSKWPRASKAGNPSKTEFAAIEAESIDPERATFAARTETAPLSSGGSPSESSPGLAPGGLDAPDGTPNTGPLREDEIASLVRASIVSLDPVERRLAFDRLLQEMESGSFTAEQAAVIRSLMHEQGASGEQWRLFDYAWGANHPEAAIAYLDEIPDQYRNGFLGNMLPGLASVEPQTAIDLYGSFDSKLQVKLRRRLYEGLIHNDPEFATSYVFDSVNPERRDWRPMDEFARQLADEQGLQASLDWAAELPEGSLRNNAWSALFAKWTSQDSMGASEALVEMPGSTDRDLAINGFSAALSTKDPESAVIWASQIENPGLREAAMIRAGERYFRQNPVAASEWFPTSGLPATALGKIIGNGGE